MLPVQGEILTSFSQGELVKDVTLGEWRTPRRVDIKADKGAEVFAAAAGSVTKVPGYPVGPGGGNHPRRRFHQPVRGLARIWR